MHKLPAENSPLKVLSCLIGSQCLTSEEENIATNALDSIHPKQMMVKFEELQQEQALLLYKMDWLEEGLKVSLRRIL